MVLLLVCFMPWSLAQSRLLIQDIGAGKGKYYAVNFPLRDGIDDESYEQIFKPVSTTLSVYPASPLLSVWFSEDEAQLLTSALIIPFHPCTCR